MSAEFRGRTSVLACPGAPNRGFRVPRREARNDPNMNEVSVARTSGRPRPIIPGTDPTFAVPPRCRSCSFRGDESGSRRLCRGATHFVRVLRLAACGAVKLPLVFVSGRRVGESATVQGVDSLRSRSEFGRLWSRQAAGRVHFGATSRGVGDCAGGRLTSFAF